MNHANEGRPAKEQVLQNRQCIIMGDHDKNQDNEGWNTSVSGESISSAGNSHHHRWYALVAISSSLACFILGRHSASRNSNTSALQPAPSRKRQSANTGSRPLCGSGKTGTDEYNTALHVGALLIILFVSFSACAFPLLALRFPKLRIPKTALFIIRHFGTGVLISTAFVHLLPTAFISLGNPCLSPFWNKDYPAMPGAIALAAIFFVTMIEMIFSPARLLAASHASEVEADNGQIDERPKLPQRQSSSMNELAMGNTNASPDFSQYGHRVTGRTTSIGRGLQLGEAGSDTTEDMPVSAVDLDASSDPELTSKQVRDKAILQCTLLEMGILFHSIFIGMSLSVTLGDDFVVLLIAIVFHQSCEGLALGARIAGVTWEPRAVRPWLMALAYGCTTPLGQAIGLATHTLYDPNSAVGLLVVGIFNAISAGLLTFASLVELLAEDFLSDNSWKVLRGRRRVTGFGLVFLGAFSMAVIGAWA